jgi:pyruvate/2-oxoacid:ferredoxin oxidoreductase alpha subunit
MTDIRIINANEAAALAAKLCRVQVVAAYPITPQTPVTEDLAAMIEAGDLKAEYLTVESEHSAMAAVVAPLRWGPGLHRNERQRLLYIRDAPLGGRLRVPVVTACVNRGVGAPWTILNDQQDSIAQRDTGWIQLYCRNNQEVLDTIVQAYVIAEEMKIPVMVCYDGFVLSHTNTPVEVPDHGEVDRFLPPCDGEHLIQEQELMNLNPLILSDPRQDASGEMKPGYMDFRFRLQEDLISSWTPSA